MNKKIDKICAYCGSQKPKTRDHIPPQCFFPEPKPSNMITVPCCEGCRREQTDDDEYFRAVVLSAFNCFYNSHARKVNEKLLRSLRKATKAGFAQHIRDSLLEVDIKSNGGIYLGQCTAIKANPERIDIVSKRIIKGLFYHEKGYRLPDNYMVVNNYYQFGFKEQVESLGPVPFHPVRIIGDKIFSYTYSTYCLDNNITIWISCFYDSLPFLGFTINTIN